MCSECVVGGECYASLTPSLSLNSNLYGMHYLPALLFDLVLLEFPNVSFEMYSSFCVCLCDLSKGSSSFCFIQRIKSWSVELILRQTDKTKCISEKQKEKRKSLFLLILLSTHNQIHSERDFGFILEPITFDT